MKITEDNFDEIFKPQINHIERAKQPKSVADEDVCGYNGCLYETYGEELEYVFNISKETPKRVWTILEGDEGMYYVTGFHRVNRIGFFVCEVEFAEEMEIKLDEDF